MPRVDSRAQIRFDLGFEWPGPVSTALRALAFLSLCSVANSVLHGCSERTCISLTSCSWDGSMFSICHYVQQGSDFERYFSV